MKPRFDPYSKEQQLQAESAQWDTRVVEETRPGDIPVIDLEGYLAGEPGARTKVAAQVRSACEDVGFFSIRGHGVPWYRVKEIFAQVRLFHALPIDDKLSIRMDRPDWPHGGMGYLPLNNSKLPARSKANFNEAFLLKCDHAIGMNDNQWPETKRLPNFRETVESYAASMNALGKSLLPAFACALEMPANYFDDAFSAPMYRLRMTHYPPIDDVAGEEFGINPHVDTTFCTILAQDSPGLTIFSERRNAWLKVPMLEEAFVVNTGELLRQWTNDRFISVKHFANNNTGANSRYSIPFFYNANAHHVMECVPSCFDENNPPRYPPVSYAASQAVAQGE